VTATDAALFQSPFRAGIRLMNHQLIPLKKALELPRCNLFIADDVGLGKTIEAGLVLQELQLRQRVQFPGAGSVRGGQRLAAVFTLVDNCLALGIQPYVYLVDVIRKRESGWPLRLLSELTPHRWAAEQAAQQRAQ
jgi:hypothetical protein